MIRPLTFTIAALLLSGCFPDASADTTDAAASAADVALAVPIVTVLPNAATSARSFVGRVQPRSTVDLAFQIHGQMIRRPVSEGDSLKEGELIAMLDPVSYELAVTRAEAAARLAQTEFDRISPLVGRVSTRAQLDGAEAERVQAETSLREARRALEQTRMTAPFPALVARTLVEEYANVTSAVPVLRLQDISEMRVTISLPEEIAALARAEPDAFRVEATFPALPDLTADLVMRNFSTEADSIAQTYAVTFAITGTPDPRLLPGMTVNVRIAPRGAGPSLEVPVGAVDTTGPDGPRIWIYDPATRTAGSRPVRVGLPRGANIVVEEGLVPGESVITAGWWQLNEGAFVRPGNL